MRPTTGKRVQCDEPTCENFNKIWVIKPEPYFEPGKLKSDLHTWPDVRCNGCKTQPVFIGYTEESTPIPEHFCLADDCCMICKRHVTPHRGCVLR